MANLEISNICNLKCPYCFASTHMEAAQITHTPRFIDTKTLEERLDFLEHSGIEQVRLIGGEPTLHPHFAEIVQRIRRRAKLLIIFSHGIIPERSLATLLTMSSHECMVLVNTNSTRTNNGPSPSENARRYKVLKQLGARAMLGFNVYKTSFQLDHLLPIIEETGCQREIRLGLAQPMLAGENAYLHSKQYRTVARKIVEFAQHAASSGVHVEFDCGFVRCMFAPEEIALLKQTGTDVAFRCNPILDIDIVGMASHCFPLTGVIEAPIANQPTATAIRELLTTQVQAYRVAGIYPECSTCPFKQRGECTGGCLALTMRRFRHRPIKMSFTVE